MATNTELLAQVVQTNTALTNTIETELDKWQEDRAVMEGKVNQHLQTITDYVGNARGGYPMIRSTKNQGLINKDDFSLSLSGWYTRLSIDNFSIAGVVSGHAPNTVTDPILAEFYSYIGAAVGNFRYNHYKYNLVRVTWSGRENGVSILGINRALQTVMRKGTFGAHIKVISGKAAMSFKGYIEPGDWALQAGYFNSGATGTADVSIRTASPEGEMLIALPAIMHGHVDISSPTSWLQTAGPVYFTDLER